MISAIGIITFVAANLLALPQTNDRRLLGYSSIAQTGLVLVVLGQRDILGDATAFIAFGLLVSHAVAKAGLFWLSGLLAGRNLEAWAALRSRPLQFLKAVRDEWQDLDARRSQRGLEAQTRETERRCDSLILRCADAHKVPAGGALAVDRDAFSAAVSDAPGVSLSVSSRRSRSRAAGNRYAGTW